MNNSSANVPPDLGVSVELTVYSTQRRLKGARDKARWQRYCPLAFGTETDVNGVLSLVCYYDDQDISNKVTDVGSGTMTIKKPEGDPENVEEDYTFSIAIQGISDSELRFEGELQDHDGDWDWRGRFSGRRTESRGQPAEEIYGPDGHTTLQELLSYPSMSTQGTNAAQEEASRILVKIIQASIPEDIQRALEINIPSLDQEEEDIRQLGPDFFPRAAVANLFKQWHGAEQVDRKQQDRIDTNQCDKFYAACAANIVPTSGADPVEEFGWNRKNDARVIRKFQGQYRRINLACYRLGYRRKVARFQPFLAHPPYWYKRMAEYLVSPTHCQRFMLRVSGRDLRVEPDIHDWYTQLFLLREAAGGDVDGAPELEDVINTLKGVALLSSINEVQLNDSFIARLKELFNQIENLVDSKEHVEITKNLAMLQEVARGGTRRSLMQFIEHYRSSCSRYPTVKDAIMSLFRNGATRSQSSNTSSISSAKCLGLSPVAWSMLAGAAMIIQFTDLLVNKDQLSFSEKSTLYLSLVPTGTEIVTNLWGLAKCMGACITEFLLSVPAVAASSSAGGFWSKVGMTVSFVLGVVVAGFCVWGAYDRFKKVWKSGKTIDICAAGCDLVLSVLFSIVAVYEGVAIICGASHAVLSFCAVLGGGIALTSVISSLAFQVVKWCQSGDPTAPFITKYGNMYNFLRQGAR